jgi:O-antigen/teichoic acid export membrane protein
MGNPAAVDPAASLTSGRRLARNSFLNLATGGSILLLNILFVPLMLGAFGMELYGVLAVTWMVLGHLRWLDLGFSAACAKYVAQDLAAGLSAQAGVWANTAVAVQAGVGICAAGALWAAAPWLVEMLRVQPETQPMVVFALRSFALVIPLDLATRSLNGVLEGAQRFDWINALSALATVWTFSVYGVGIWRGGDFPVVVYGLVALKVVHLVAAYWAAGRIVPSLGWRSGRPRVADAGRIGQMLRFGGWVSVSTAIGPALQFFDRWVIGALRGVALLPLYTVPFSLFMSLHILPGSLASTLFPAFSAMGSGAGWERVQRLFVQAHRFLLLVLIPLNFCLFIWAPELLRLWVGAEFAAQAALPFRILLVGFGIGLFAPFSGVLLQGMGRPDILSKIYLAELIPNILLTLFLVRSHGIVGAAAAYSVRAVVETLSLWVAVAWVFPVSWRQCARQVLRPAAVLALAALVGVALLLPEAHIRSPVALGVTGLVLVVYAWAGYFHLLDADDRAFLRRLT